MSKGLFRVVALMLVVILIGMVGCKGKTPEQKRQESRLEKMRPKAEDRLSTLMGRSWDNLTYMMYGFLNYDKVKIETAVANMVSLSPYIEKRITPTHREHIDKWEKRCNLQQTTTGNIKRSFLDEDFEASRTYLHQLIENCMDCHKLHRKHLLRPEEETPEEGLELKNDQD